MKNKELIKILQTFDPELEIMTAVDDEGNGFREVYAGYVSVEKFDDDNELYSEEDYHDFPNLKDRILIG